MKRTHQIMLLSLSVLLLVVACRKVNNSRSTEPPPYAGNPGGPPPGYPGTTTVSLNELFKEFRSIPEKQCVTAGIPQTVTFAKGTRLTFYPNSFKDEAGNIISSGTVCLEVTEMYKAGDMIANGASTSTADGGILRSGGQVHINATQNGVKVYANVYGISFRHSTASSQPMDLYYGSRNNKDSVTTWTIANTALPGTTAPGTSSDTVDYRYIFDSCHNFGFINCDKLIGLGPMKRVNIVVPDTSYRLGNTRIFVVVKSANAVVYTYGPWSPSSPLQTTWWTNIPENTSIHVIVMTRKTDSYYYFEKEMEVLTEEVSVSATMTKRTKDYIEASMAKL